ncbi:MAG: IS3 family transposase [Bacteroidales bacterium]|jgi:transposase InsO family protein|nr:IS3 family transposase [Bacteroidales bacterium]
MKTSHQHISLGVMCLWFGISRQAYYQHERNLSEEVYQNSFLIEKIRDIRKRHQRMGVRKLQELLRPFLCEHGIKIGRDALFNLLSVHGMLVRRRKRNVKTTHSHHWLKKYPNLIVDFMPIKPNELWVSDITYWQIDEQPVYLSLITDAYSRKIVGYHLSENLHAKQTLKALQMALSSLGEQATIAKNLIHHSDRGVQYCSSSYINQLKKKHIKISMTQSGDPLENAIAERVNGIIKDEYLFNYQCDNIKDARKQLAIAVAFYNKERPHNSIGNLTPEVVHSQFHKIENEKVKRLWKSYFRKNPIFVNQKQD